MTRREPMPTWVLALIVGGLLVAVIWDVLLDVGRMGFFWGWWGR